MRDYLWLLVSLPIVAFPAPLLAAEHEGATWPSVLLRLAPLLVIVVLWIYFMRRSGLTKQRDVIERNLLHMDAIEGKLDRVIELLERKTGR